MNSKFIELEQKLISFLETGRNELCGQEYEDYMYDLSCEIQDAYDNNKITQDELFELNKI